MNKRYSEYLSLIEDRLNNLLKSDSDDIVTEAMKYSLFAGGKRVRALLTLEFCYLCGGDINKSIDYACAVEMIHTYSLIHDDLPCMDDDDMRRGKPSCHVKFGENYALLAGDGLLTLAFETISKCKNSFQNNCLAVCALSQCAGYAGMIGGQTLDLQNECKAVDLDTIQKTDFLKTSKLIEAACVLGCVSASAEEKYINTAADYAENMGLAFQIVDDILDVTSSSEELGKPVGSDDENKKSTYVSILGLEESEKMAARFTDKALTSLDLFGDKADELKEFTINLLSRKK